MEEHKLLTGMLLVALVVSVVGTVITIDRLGMIGVGSSSGSGFTGAATGTSDIVVTTTASVTVTNSTLSLGAGTVASNATFTLIDTASATGVDDGTWVNGTKNLTIENDGNVGINVTIQSNVTRGNATGADTGSYSFACSGETGGDACGGAFTNNTGVELEFAYFYLDSEDGSCTAGMDTSDYQSFNNSAVEYKLCGCLSPTDSRDEGAVYLQIGIPNDAAGTKEATLTFTATQSDITC
jgi:hypothetical protein